MKRQIIGAIALGSLLFAQTVVAQSPGEQIDGSNRAISTAVPFLRIAPDARGGSMGDVGIAVSPDANSQYYNIAKIAKSEKDMSFSVSYSPWLKELGMDIWLGYLAGYKKFGQNGEQAISASMRFFNLGDMPYTDKEGNAITTGRPREMAFDLGYSRELSENLSVGIALRYINSNIAAGSVDNNYNAANAFAGDVGVYYTKNTVVDEDRYSNISLGAVLSNLGSRVTYTQSQRDYLPANLGIGGAYTYKVDRYNKITAALDLNKAITPAPEAYEENGKTKYRYPDMSVVSGVFNSFSNAPPGYGTTIGVGAEYWYQEQFAARAGYFYENKNNGNRQYLTVGLGVKYNIFGLDFSYLVPSGSSLTRNPLANTLRFTLSFDFDKNEKPQSTQTKS